MTRGVGRAAGLVAAMTLLGTASAASGQDAEDAEETGAEDDGYASDDLGEVDGGEPVHDASVTFDVHATVGWYAATGGGIRLDLPVVREGLIDQVEDDLRLSLGAEVLWYWNHDDQIGFYPLAVLQWNFYLNDSWSVFPEVGFVLMFPRPHFWRTFIAPVLSMGARYHFTARNALLIRVTWPHGLQLGITF